MKALNPKLDAILKSNTKAKRASMEKFLRWQERVKDNRFSTDPRCSRHGYSLKQLGDIFDGNL